ncbi:hypothetical protein CQW23_32279 [Capsicum baccatum]|uniref:Saposin B-type domain-containing protein n=1 Tax=Capsicum baccatum TaxID=33114 RepID=A0A2G2V5C5_CAPBA|nr:hypothetical protein CQW23_32279 [Capsicum baccatum]
MDLRLRLTTLFILGSSWCCTARDLPAGNPLVSQTEEDVYDTFSFSFDNDYIRVVIKSWGSCMLKRRIVYVGFIAPVLQINNNVEEGRQVQQPPLEEVNVDEQLCTLCEEYTARAVKYMANNKTQTEIIDLLHKSCLKMRFYKQEILCAILVDLYAPLFFLEINKMGPEEFGFCGLGIAISHVLSGKIKLQFMPPTSY